MSPEPLPFPTFHYGCDEVADGIEGFVERYEIETFLVLAEELHFARAAARLRVSSGRVSQTVQKLERRIGAALFDRTSRRVALTAIGVQFDRELRPGYMQVQSALESAVEAARGFEGTFRVGYLGAAAGEFTLRVAQEFRTEYPAVDVYVHELQTHESVHCLHDGTTDMVLNTQPISGPDIVYAPFRDAGPLNWGFLWRASHETARIRAFNDIGVRLSQELGA
ncbi:LysR family transcriptional regulator [Nocardia sp. GCM10030253]|uniref:LysR family transcriptional regulator n=1 Tax=Nocardia sp. GCM10030253 TaxID=3273404 RepID=UPI003624C41A